MWNTVKGDLMIFIIFFFKLLNADSVGHLVGRMRQRLQGNGQEEAPLQKRIDL